ncbi:chemotaxis protein CheX [Desulfobulbus sp.]|uniref:chemotaxis protein CheX n=1 Tax=Desulfobulbus sp. TaxID=895 RepID=UPI00286F90A3|nr:chemotaxis protein CheX [Desulfobulbus sp.]
MEIEQFLVDATLEVFASIIPLDIAPEPVGCDAPAVEPDVSSLIGLAGDLKGVLAVHCPASVALGVTSAMLGMEVAALDEDVKDALGEIANMVAGGLKISLAALNKKIELSIATTCIGKSIRTGGLAGATRATVIFATPAGRFRIELRYILV